MPFINSIKLEGINYLYSPKNNIKMKKIIILLSILMYINMLFAQKTLITYRKGELWGYADTTGKIIIKPKSDKVFVHNDFERLKLLKDKKTGIINEKGEIVIPIDYQVINSANKVGFTVFENSEYRFFSYTGKDVLKKSFKYMALIKDSILFLEDDKY